MPTPGPSPCGQSTAGVIGCPSPGAQRRDGTISTAEHVGHLRGPGQLAWRALRHADRTLRAEPRCPFAEAVTQQPFRTRGSPAPSAVCAAPFSGTLTGTSVSGNTTMAMAMTGDVCVDPSTGLVTKSELRGTMNAGTQGTGTVHFVSTAKKL